MRSIPGDSRPPAVRSLTFSTSLHNQLANENVAFKGAIMESGPASVVPVQLVEPSIQQEFDRFRISLGSSHRENCAALRID